VSEYFHTEAFALKKQPWKDYGGLYVFYTKSMGKVHAVAQSSRKITSKLSAHLEPFGPTSLSLVRRNSWFRITSARRIRVFENMFSSGDALNSYAESLKIIDDMTRVGHPDLNLFSLLEEYFLALENFTGLHQSLKSIFILRLLSVLGYCPELNSCVQCKRATGATSAIFSFEKGGFLCRLCEKHGTGKELGEEEVVLLRETLRRSLYEVAMMRTEERVRMSFSDTVEKFREYQQA